VAEGANARILKLDLTKTDKKGHARVTVWADGLPVFHIFANSNILRKNFGKGDPHSHVFMMCFMLPDINITIVINIIIIIIIIIVIIIIIIIIITIIIIIIILIIIVTTICSHTDVAG
jgi:hypothetical protein